MNIGKDSWILIIKKLSGMEKVRLSQVSKSLKKLIYDNLELNLSMDQVIKNQMFLEIKNIAWDPLVLYSYIDIVLNSKSKPIIRYYLNLLKSECDMDYIDYTESETLHTTPISHMIAFKISAIFGNYSICSSIARNCIYYHIYSIDTFIQVYYKYTDMELTTKFAEEFKFNQINRIDLDVLLSTDAF